MVGLFPESLPGLLEDFLALAQQPGGTNPAQALGQGLPGQALTACALTDAPLQAVLQIVQLLQPILKTAAGMGALETLSNAGKFMSFVFQPLARELAEAAAGFGHKLAAREYALGNNLGGGAGRGGAEVGDKIADSEIDFMSYGRDDGKAGMEDSAGDNLFVEGP